jgi:hypothetical protein
MNPKRHFTRGLFAEGDQEPPRPRGEPLDPIVEETIRLAMEPYIGVLPPAGLQSMRDALEDALTTHPVALEALAALEKRPTVDRSGTRRRDDGEDDGEDEDSGGEEGVA